MALKNIAVIPARFAAQRFPGKLMENLGEKSVILTTYEAVVNTGLFDAVMVVTDHPTIYNHLKEYGAQVMLSDQPYACGSDRIAAAVAAMDVDIVLNVQGDEPFIDRNSLANLLAVFEADQEESIALASLKTVIKNPEEINNPNVVKVIVDQNDCALYFSRSPIPYYRAADAEVPVYRHIGVYAFRKNALMAFSAHPQTPLELAEQIECIRYLESGKTIKMVTTSHRGIGIDTPEDLEAARAFIKSQKS